MTVKSGIDDTGVKNAKHGDASTQMANPPTLQPLRGLRRGRLIGTGRRSRKGDGGGFFTSGFAISRGPSGAANRWSLFIELSEGHV